MMRKFKVKLETIKGRQFTFDWDVAHAHVYNCEHIADLFLTHKYVEVGGKGKKSVVVPVSAIDNFAITEITKGKFNNEEEDDHYEF